MKIALLALFLFNAALFVSPLPTEASSEKVTLNSEYVIEYAKSKSGKRLKVKYKTILRQPSIGTLQVLVNGRWEYAVQSEEGFNTGIFYFYRFGEKFYFCEAAKKNLATD